MLFKEKSGIAVVTIAIVDKVIQEMTDWVKTTSLIKETGSWGNTKIFNKYCYCTAIN